MLLQALILRQTGGDLELMGHIDILNEVEMSLVLGPKRVSIMQVSTTTKWTKLDLLESRLKGLGTSEVAEHRQLGRMFNSFIFGLEETRENLELELATVLRRIGVDRSSTGVAIAASVDVAPDGKLQLQGNAFDYLL
ncbi:hypothetical protein AXG93_3253s1120 [Marchantia polymorpha subsp. ruderalis]|uniref:Uncharacterized protein n=1 Tax=Marchantia polymorpha subsp. ruderalis TaxID=1480154 RepID=A0A176WRY2_MARPO|nr:hypothetical protein AXG93_3253s1120 [Marchantia polymorpha subsp. ruderalis]